MSTQILTNIRGYSALYCSTTEVAFGPIFYPHEDAQRFLDWLVVDPRSLDHSEIAMKLAEWRQILELREKPKKHHHGRPKSCGICGEAPKDCPGHTEEEMTSGEPTV